MPGMDAPPSALLIAAVGLLGSLIGGERVGARSTLRTGPRDEASDHECGEEETEDDETISHVFGVKSLE